MDSKRSRDLLALQEGLLQKSEAFFSDAGISTTLRNAFLDTPRHRFVRRFQSRSSGRWIELNPNNLSKHLRELYDDSPLCILRNGQGGIVSTISQPSLVLNMIELLDLKPGHTVFELGGGSGWHSALMAKLVAPHGEVHSMEIEGELVRMARESNASLEIDNVFFHHGDGSEGLKKAAPFDRGVFTAAAWELPKVFFTQIKEGGRLIFIMKQRHSNDLLTVLQKRPDCFESVLHFPCSFVSLTGSGFRDEDTIPLIEENTAWIQARGIPLQTSLWKDFDLPANRLSAFFQFCITVEKDFNQFDSQHYPELRSKEFLCGLVDKESPSLALATEDGIASYGNSKASVQMRRLIEDWNHLGRIDAIDLKLKIYPKNASLEPQAGSWNRYFKESLCLWLA